jgi:hypothetical protein
MSSIDLDGIAVFNVLFHNVSPSNTASVNATNLQTLIGIAQGAGGGVILFPSVGTFQIQGPITIGTQATPNATPLVIAGTAQGTQEFPVLLNIMNGGLANNTDLFSVFTAATPGPYGDDDVGGITFQNLHIQYVSAITGSSPATAGIAVHVVNAQNVRVNQCVFFDCPQAVAFDDTLQCSMYECKAQYSNHGDVVPAPACVTVGTAVMGEAGKETLITGCTLLSSNGGVGLLVIGSEHLRVLSTRIDGFFSGIEIFPGQGTGGGHNALRHFFSDVTVYAGAAVGAPTVAGKAVTIMPQGVGALPSNLDVAQIVFSGCAFEPGANFGPGLGLTGSSTGPGVTITPNGGIVDNVRFVSCYSTRWTGPGLAINGGTNIEVQGGMYSGNNLGGSGTQPYGIAIIGPANGVRITGASCVGQYEYIEIGSSHESPPQAVGIFVDQGASDLLIHACDLRGNSQAGLSVHGETGGVTTNVFTRHCDLNGYVTPAAPVVTSGTISNLQVTDCAGYNDQATVLSSPPTPPPVHNVTFSNTTFGYYGPIQFSIWGTTPVSGVTLGAIVTTLTSGTFSLAPNEGASLQYTPATPPKFGVIGQ